MLYFLLMASKKNLSIITISILLNLIIGFHKRCIPRNFTLTGGISNFVHGKDSVLIGDTLWFNSSFPVNLKYLSAGGNDSSVINLSGASNVATDIHFNAIPKKDTITEALDSFILIPQKGEIKVNSLSSRNTETITFKEEQSNFVVSFGIIAQKRGIYCITILDLYQVMKNCTKASVTIPINSTINQHLNFLDSVYFAGSRYENTIPDYELTHDYCFEVY